MRTKLPKLTITITLITLLAGSTALAGWADALIKQVAKDVAVDTAKRETTKAVMNQFTKDDPAYQGPKTAEEAEAAATALTAGAIELPALNAKKDFDGEKAFPRMLKKTNRIVVGGFRVQFIHSNVATASENNSLLNIGNTAASSTGFTTVHQDRTVKKEKILHGIDEAVMQRIADEAYAGFLSQLKQSGLEVLPTSTFTGSSHFADIDTTPVPYIKSAGMFRPNDVHTYSPSELPLWFGHWDTGFGGNKGALSIGTWKTLNKIAHENDTIVIVPHYVINFASMQSSGRGSMFKKASVEAQNVVHLLGGMSGINVFQCSKPSAGGDLGRVSLKKSIYVPGEFAVDYLVDESDNASIVNSITRLTGTAGNIHEHETWAVFANPSIFEEQALAAVENANAAVVALIQ